MTTCQSRAKRVLPVLLTAAAMCATTASPVLAHEEPARTQLVSPAAGPVATVVANEVPIGHWVPVQITGTPNDLIDLLAYSRPDTTMDVVRTLRLNNEGRGSTAIRPGGDTRLLAKSRDSGKAGASIVIGVRYYVSLGAGSAGNGTHNFVGTAVPRRAGVPVTIHRGLTNGQRQVVGRGLTDANGRYAIPVRFSDTGTMYFVATAEGTSQNRQGISQAIPVSVRQNTAPTPRPPGGGITIVNNNTIIINGPSSGSGGDRPVGGSGGNQTPIDGGNGGGGGNNPGTGDPKPDLRVAVKAIPFKTGSVGTRLAPIEHVIRFEAPVTLAGEYVDDDELTFAWDFDAGTGEGKVDLRGSKGEKVKFPRDDPNAPELDPNAPVIKYNWATAYSGPVEVTVMTKDKRHVGTGRVDVDFSREPDYMWFPGPDTWEAGKDKRLLFDKRATEVGANNQQGREVACNAIGVPQIPGIGLQGLCEAVYAEYQGHAKEAMRRNQCLALKVPDAWELATGDEEGSKVEWIYYPGPGEPKEVTDFCQ